MAVKKGGLGKGLDSLITDKVSKNTTVKKTVEKEKVTEDTLIPINQVEPNRDQPRKSFDEDALLELAE